MATEVLSPARANSRASVLDPLLSKSTLTIPETRPREGSVTSNSASSVRSASSRPESVAALSPTTDGYDYEGAPQAPPIPGFVVASSKRNADFHELFPNVPEGDYLVQDYGCAWHREILIQGRLYISENHLCFYANIFGWITSITLPFLDVSTIEKRMTAYVIPNAIFVNTFGGTEYTFASFLTRDTVYDVMQSLWRPSRPASGQVEGNNKEDSDEVEAVDGEGSGDSPAGHKVTECVCGKNGEHYSTVVADYKLPGTPEKIYGLMFKDPFLLEFLKNDQKLIDVQISEWTPKEPDLPLMTRDMSFIKPLSGGLGPKQTKCEIKDEILHADFDDYVSVLTTTRTPDVPNGSIFSVKTRVCLTWAGSVSTRCVVTSVVDWTGRSFIRAVIDRSAIDGQKQHQQDLEKAMRKHIAANRSEFIPKGAVIQEVEAMNGAVTSNGTSEAKPHESSSIQEPGQIAAVLQLVRQLAQDAFGHIKQVPSTHALGLLVLVLALSNIWSLLRPIPEPRVPGDAQALKARLKAEKKGKIDMRVEIRELRRSMEMIDRRLEKIEASLGALD